MKSSPTQSQIQAFKDYGERLLRNEVEGWEPPLDGYVDYCITFQHTADRLPFPPNVDFYLMEIDGVEWFYRPHPGWN
jgi:hypothetical protein